MLHLNTDSQLIVAVSKKEFGQYFDETNIENPTLKCTLLVDMQPVLDVKNFIDKDKKINKGTTILRETSEISAGELDGMLVYKIEKI